MRSTKSFYSESKWTGHTVYEQTFWNQENSPNMMTIVLIRGIRVTGSKAGPVKPPWVLFKPSVTVRLPWLHCVLWVYMVIESMAIYIKNPEGIKDDIKTVFFPMNYIYQLQLQFYTNLKWTVELFDLLCPSNWLR